MLVFYDAKLEFRDEATIKGLIELKTYLKALKIEAIGLDTEDFRRHTYELSFTIYGNFGPFMMKKVVQERTEKIFPGSILGLSQRDSQ